MRCYDGIDSSFVRKVRGEVFAHSHAVAVEVTVVRGIDLFRLLGRILLWTIPLMSKKMMSMLLIMLFTCLAFLFAVTLNFACTVRAFFPKCLSNHCQSLRDLHKKWCTLAVPLADPSHQTRFTTPNRRKISTHLSTVESRYCNCCTDVSTSCGNYGYSLVCSLTGGAIGVTTALSCITCVFSVSSFCWLGTTFLSYVASLIVRFQPGWFNVNAQDFYLHSEGFEPRLDNLDLFLFPSVSTGKMLKCFHR
jgi:hypothetical protein